MIVSIGIAFGVGVVLTRNAVETANIDGLNRQAELIKNQEESAHPPVQRSRISSCSSFLARAARADRPLRARQADAVPAGLAAARRCSPGVVEGHGHRRRRRATSYAAASEHQEPARQGLRPAPAVEPEGGRLGPVPRALLIAGAIGGRARRARLARSSRAGSPGPSGGWPRRAGASPRASRRSPVPLGGSAELAMLAQTFNDMAAQLHRAREAERNFLLSVSHELKTPLAAIRGYAEGLEEGIFTARRGRGDDPGGGAAARAARPRPARPGADEPARVRRPSRADRPRRGRPRGRRGATRRTRAAAASSSSAGVSRAAPAIADPDRVLQIVSNLVENALRSTPAGGTRPRARRPGLLVGRGHRRRPGARRPPAHVRALLPPRPATRTAAGSAPASDSRSSRS